MLAPASSASRSRVLIGVTCDTTSTVSPRCSEMIRARALPHPFGRVIEALAAGRRNGGVAQPALVQLRIPFGGLDERHALPCAEVGFDEVVVDGDVETERLGRRRRGVVSPLQR